MNGFVYEKISNGSISPIIPSFFKVSAIASYYIKLST